MTTELVIAMPALLLLVLISVQVGLWFHARSIVTAAAQEGAAAARVQGGTNADGTAHADQALRQLGPNVVTDPTVTVARNQNAVTVTVTGHSPQVIPGLTIDVSATVTSPIEEFHPA